MRNALLAADDHSKIRQRPGAQLAEHRGERCTCGALFLRRKCRRKLNLALVAHPRNARRRYDGAIHHAGLSRLRAQRTRVVVVTAWPLHEMEYGFMNVTEPIGARIHTALDLVPDHAVAQDPALSVHELERQAPRDAEQRLPRVAVTHVEP